jgi:hypothetical protein
MRGQWPDTSIIISSMYINQNINFLTVLSIVLFNWCMTDQDFCRHWSCGWWENQLA